MLNCRFSIVDCRLKDQGFALLPSHPWLSANAHPNDSNRRIRFRNRQSKIVNRQSHYSFIITSTQSPAARLVCLGWTTMKQLAMATPTRSPEPCQATVVTVASPEELSTRAGRN